ncbi:MAG: TIGR04282 family arsenosugar biosynthesis glycosyltransferase [Cycloclasticus sp.]|nr:TIGR04282 family arsenosugar biosynthesis glycosyltransferase [Cycloclasticus sp.]
MSKTLLIVFVKNIRLGKVKTRLAKAIGTEGAFQVYKHLVEITENVTNQVCSDKRVYFSDVIIEKKWPKTSKSIQKGTDLGEKMQNSFKNGQKEGFDKVVLIGSDLPDISPEIIQKGFDELENHEVVFGPAEDGGYYLVGMTKPHFCIFKNKQWSTETLLKETLNELEEKGVGYSLLETLNDVDSIEDLKNSSIASEFEGLIRPYL